MSPKKKILIGVYAFIFITLISITAYLSLPKKITLVVDNDVKEIKTGYIFTNEFIDKYMSEVEKDYIVETENNTLDLIALSNSITIKTKKDIKVIIGTEEREVSTYAVIVKELYTELELKNDGMNEYVLKEIDEDSLLNDGDTIKISHITKDTKEETKEEYLSIIYKNNNSLYVGDSKVVTNALPKKILEVYDITYENGKEINKVLVSSTIIQNGIAKVVEQGTKVYVPSTTTVSGDVTVWDNLAQCESSGNWHVNSGNGYYGGLQFSAATWRNAASAVGVKASYAHQASKAEQILAATWLQKNYGWGQWPECSRKLGL